MVDIEYLKEQIMIIIEHHNKVYGITTPLFKAERNMIAELNYQIKALKILRGDMK